MRTTADPEEAVSSETAYVMNKLLQDVVNNGTVRRQSWKTSTLPEKQVLHRIGTT